MSEPTGAPTVANPYLEGNYAPVTVELTVERPLPIDGSIPPDLEGMLLRNGPNPAVPPDPARYHWFSGDGMVHAVELRDGQAVSYRNRWVRTRKLAAAMGTAPPRGPIEPLNGPANTHVIAHGGRILALVESGFAHRLSPELATLCIEDFDGMLTSPMTAHPHADPETGALAFFGYDLFGPPYLRYHELDRLGSLVHTTEVEIPRPTMQHDFGVTASRVAFLDLPVVFDFDLATEGVELPFRWDPEAGARIGVLGRGGRCRRAVGGPRPLLRVPRGQRLRRRPRGGARRVPLREDLRHRRGRAPRLDAARPATVAGRRRRRAGGDHGPRRPLRRVPRVDDHLAGRPYRYGYCTEIVREAGTDRFAGLVRYDMVRDEAVHHEFGEGRAAGEAVFVRAPDGRADDEGWVLAVVYDAARGASDLVILDATSFAGPPEAVVHLPARVPFGFHGSWVPATRYR